MALFRHDLDRMTCGRPGCDHSSHDGLILHSRCHIKTPTWVEYKDGILTVRCSLCNSTIAEIAVHGLTPEMVERARLGAQAEWAREGHEGEVGSQAQYHVAGLCGEAAIRAAFTEPHEQNVLTNPDVADALSDIEQQALDQLDAFEKDL